MACCIAPFKQICVQITCLKLIKLFFQINRFICHVPNEISIINEKIKKTVGQKTGLKKNLNFIFKLFLMTNY